MTKLPLKLNLMPLTGLVMAAWLALTPVAAQAQDAGKDAFKKCEAELMTDYANKISRAQADGKPHLIPIYERRRGEAIANLCPLQADIAAADQKIAAADQKIAANRADIAANRADIAANRADIAANRADIAAAEQT